MIIDIEELLSSVPAIQLPGVRIGFPDDATPLQIVNRESLCKCLERALCDFREARGKSDFLVSATVNTYRREVWVRFVLRVPRQERGGQIEPALEPAFRVLRTELTVNGGSLHYYGGDCFFDMTFPFQAFQRDDSLKIDHLPWEDQYRQLLQRASWMSLRRRVYRFSALAQAFAKRCDARRISQVLVPSVGLCVHPWLFADFGLSVFATDTSRSALAALSEPNRWPQLYSHPAYERWGIQESASYATQGNPDHFDRFPDLADLRRRNSLRQRITFSLSDWAALPLAKGSVDAIFATNALPREKPVERRRVLEEWIRVVRAGGLIFIAQHNFYDPEVEQLLQTAGWVEANILGREDSVQSGLTNFELQYSSG